ncbi:glycosyltransferase family 4 protein [Methylocaldum sp. GT1TLB]|uniref:glycosyltransferase family 4 protein n=1 Tax=Methylocaldum sp. GT1TLB TaxID=3438965 RepID=UPI003DA14828
MRLVFIHPPLDACPSGGNVFNRQIIRQARETSFPLEAAEVPPDGAIPYLPRNAIILWDSLLLEDLSNYPLEQFPIRCQSARQVGRQSLADLSARQRTSSEGASWRSQDGRLRLGRDCRPTFFPPDTKPYTGMKNALAGDEAVHGLLVHYVPFLNPLLDADRRKEEEDRFERAAERVRFFIATGLSIRCLLERRYPGKPAFLCEPGVDAAFLAARQASGKRSTDQPVQIATVANLLPAKGLTELLEILAGLRQCDWAWHVAGYDRIDPNYAGRFRSRIADLGLQTRIFLHGVLDTPELARFLGGMDVFAFASRFEAYGMALAEAAAVGLPAVITDVGEASRIVRHGETGFVVPLADREAFRNGLERLLSDRDLRRRYRSRLLRNTPRTWDAAFVDFRNAVEAVALRSSGTTV